MHDFHGFNYEAARRRFRSYETGTGRPNRRNELTEERLKMARKKSAAGGAKEPAIEAAMTELQDIVQSLESGQEPLDVSLQQFERGMTLLRICHRQLEQAASRIEILTGIDSDGGVMTASFDGSATATAARKVEPDFTEVDNEDEIDEEDGVDPAALF